MWRVFRWLGGRGCLPLPILKLFEFMQCLVLEEIDIERSINVDSYIDTTPQKINRCRYKLTA